MYFDKIIVFIADRNVSLSWSLLILIDVIVNHCSLEQLAICWFAGVVCYTESESLGAPAMLLSSGHHGNQKDSCVRSARNATGVGASRELQLYLLQPITPPQHRTGATQGQGFTSMGDNPSTTELFTVHCRTNWCFMEVHQGWVFVVVVVVVLGVGSCDCLCVCALELELFMLMCAIDCCGGVLNIRSQAAPTVWSFSISTGSVYGLWGQVCLIRSCYLSALLFCLSAC